MLQAQLAMDTMTKSMYRNRVLVDELPVSDYSGDNWAYPWHMVRTNLGIIRQDYKLPSDGIRAMKSWCSDNTRGAWSSYIGEFFFEDERDAQWFRLRWSCL